MGLFSTLGEGGPEASSSATVPTVIQLYSAGAKPIQLDTTSRVSGYTALTYQAIQVGSSAEVEPKNRHQNPDLGIWNCAVRKQTPTSTTAAATTPADGGTGEDSGAADDSAPQASAPTPLVDHLLSKVTKDVSTFCVSVDLTEEETVEPTMALLQEALVRHLIENPPSQSSAGAGDGTGADGMEGVEGDPANPEGGPAAASTATTSLHQLKSTTFGLADEDKSPKKGQTATSENEEEKDKEIKTSLMICALLPVSSGEEASEVAYRKKQARALVIYHLRKFAASLNAALLFVNRQDPSSADPGNNPASSVPGTPTAGGGTAAGGTGGDEGESSSTQNQEQPTVSADAVSKLWRDYAMGEPVWMTASHGDATVVEASTEGGDDAAAADKDDAKVSVTIHSTPLYGPGHHQEDLIETVLLRNAHCPGHWDASKDSLWVALPLVIDEKPETPLNTSGDEGWLSQLRNSIASAEPVKAATPDKPKEETPKKKDEAVSSFFESLLKNP